MPFDSDIRFDSPKKMLEIEAELISSIYKALPLMHLAVIINATAILLIMLPIYDFSSLITWYLLVLAVSAFRLYSVKRFNDIQPKIDEIVRWRDYIVLGAIANALVWAAVPWLFWSTPHALYQAFIVMIFAGMNAGALSTASPVLLAALSFITLTCSSLIIRFAVDGTPISWIMAAITLLFLLILIITSRRLNQMLARNIKSRIDQQEAEYQMEQMAMYDHLTGLPNRRYFLKEMEQELSRSKRYGHICALLFIDLDDFKKINDTLGHEMGDKLLIEAAERLKGTVRNVDTVGRLGGDEFVVLLGNLSDMSEAQPVAENLLAQFRDPFTVEERELVLTASIGITIYPNDGKSPSELLRNADSAMYHSKDTGRNTYSYFTDNMNLQIERRLSIEEQLHGALERNEFEVFFQPQISIENGEIIGAEALVRWHNKSLANISPAEFIPIAEQTGLIVPIGKYVMGEAMSMAAAWQQSFRNDFRIAVNLSPRQFHDPNLVTFIQNKIQQSGIRAESLELEITEGVLMERHARIDADLTALTKMGISIAMDDFGTGYSSLSYLRRYPFEILKIDRSFVNDITADADTRELIQATVSMSHNLGLKVVAEGVETEEQLAFLNEISCDFAQGYLFGKPVPGNEITRILDSKSDS